APITPNDWPLLTVLLVRVRLPLLKMSPPWLPATLRLFAGLASPLVIVRPEMTTVAFGEVILKTRTPLVTPTPKPTVPPLMVSLPDPGPWMVMLFEISSSLVLSVMVEEPMALVSKVMRLLAVAGSRSAWLMQ